MSLEVSVRQTAIEKEDFNIQLSNFLENLFAKLDRPQIDQISKILLRNTKYDPKELGTYEKVQVTDTDITCNVCIEKLNLKQYKRTLCCGHTFHKKCVDKWIKKNPSCPLCRRNAFAIFNEGCFH